jgi:pimeloyl-ACP methyl ester carboxylesterase
MFLKTADAEIFVNDFGPLGAQTLVSHGRWVGSGELWLQPFEQLSRRWRCVTYDHRGTSSTRHRVGPTTPQILVDDLFRVLDALQVERCVLAGESMGGVTALQAILRAPDRFSGLVLVGARYQGKAERRRAKASRRVQGRLPRHDECFRDRLHP